MNMTSIADKSYIKVKCDPTRPHGGYQCWFDDKSEDFRTRHIFHGGCGVVAATDLVIYLSRMNGQNINNLDISGEIDKESYMAFVRRMSDYITPKNFEKIPKAITKGTGTIGVFPRDFIRGITRFAADAGVTINPRFVPYRSSYLLSEIRESLKNNIPVPLKIGYGHGIQFFTDDMQPASKLIKWHWVTVISLDNDGIMDIISWGRHYKIKAEDYIENAGMYAGAVIIPPVPLS